MKKLLIFVVVLSFISCSSELKILSAKKTLIIPGVHSAKQYYKYEIDIHKKSNKVLTINHIRINNDGVCYQPEFILVKEQSSKQLTAFSENGVYKLSVSLLNTDPLKSDCSIAKNGAAIYFKENDKSKVITIKAFSEEKKNRR